MPPSTRSGSSSRCSRGGPEMPAFPTEEWFQAYIEAVNASEEYAEYAATWEGDAVIHVEAEPDKGIATDVRGLLDLWHGGCPGGGLLHEGRGGAPPVVVPPPLPPWGGES